MNEHDKNFIKNMSPLLITAVVMFFMMVAYETRADDKEVIGYTEHGIAVTKDALEIKTFNFTRVRGWDWNSETNTLTLKFRNKKHIDVEFYNRCWNMRQASALQFNSFAGTSFMGKGDNITPIGGFIGTVNYPCRIKSMYLVADVG